MSFDHLPGETKVDDISRESAGYAPEINPPWGGRPEVPLDRAQMAAQTSG